MESFTWKSPEELADDEARRAPQDIETRYIGTRDIDPEGVVAWNRFVQRLSEPEAALTSFLRATQPLQRNPALKRVFISHRMGTAAWAERIAWLASQEAGLEYWLDVHDPVLRLAGAVLNPGDPRYAVTIAAIIEMALLNCTHVIAMHTPPPPQTNPPTPWQPSQWIPYELGRAKSRSVFSGQMAGWFHSDVRPPHSRGEYVSLADIRFSDDDVEDWLTSHGNPTAKVDPSARKKYLGRGTPIPPDALP